jgi:hypothetical protein
MRMTQFWIHKLAVEKDYPRRKEIVHKLIWIYLFQLPGHHLNELIFFGVSSTYKAEIVLKLPLFAISYIFISPSIEQRKKFQILMRCHIVFVK